MIFSEKWLREWVDCGFETRELTERLTMAGLEAGIGAPVAHDFSGVVVAAVKSVEAHPESSRLSICNVDDGHGRHQVVCGAANVRVGMKVALARPGAEIHVADEDRSVHIRTLELRGVESSGMLCSAAELGLAERSDGILELPAAAPTGRDLGDYLDLDDTRIELDLTPNRGDCLGMVGLAREVGVLARAEVRQPSLQMVEPDIDEEFPVVISAADACPRYLGRIIRNIDPQAQAPLWLRERLRRCGLRSIDPVVDVTNYVLLELGQPLHAFDHASLTGNIEVRMGEAGERLTLLDGREVELTPDILVIADRSKVVALAGIMGGMATAVSNTTRDVFLECAFFAPTAIGGRARALGMHTDASQRYERGVDYELQHRAMERATRLLLDIAGGQAGPVTEAIGNLPRAPRVGLSFANVSRLLGIELPRDTITDILQRLGFVIAARPPGGLQVDVPSFRFDVRIEADLIEEIARVYGYDRLPKAPGIGALPIQPQAGNKVPLSRIRQQLVGLGYQEIVTYSFIDPRLSATVNGAEADAIPLQNPISRDMSVLRSSLLPGLLATLQYNANRHHERLRLFESGLVFNTDGDEIAQVAMIAGLVSGSRYPLNWNNNQETSDFYDIKGDVESLLDMGVRKHDDEWRCVAADAAAFHPGQCARIETLAGEVIGRLGALHPAVQRELDLDVEVFLFELYLEQVQAARRQPTSRVSPYPEVSRDLAVVVDDGVAAEALLRVTRSAAGEFLTNLGIFDVYRGEGIATGQKSVALGLTWQHPSRTLGDGEISAIISNCVKALQQQFNANLRN